MKEFVSKQTRYAIYDPDREMFLSNSQDWTKNVNEIWSLLDLAGVVEQSKYGIVANVPHAFIAEITRTVNITVTSPCAATDSLEAKYSKLVGIYNELFPIWNRDPDDLTSKQWETFKAARTQLKRVGILGEDTPI